MDWSSICQSIRSDITRNLHLTGTSEREGRKEEGGERESGGRDKEGGREDI